MQRITREAVFEIHESEPKRRCFETDSGIQDKKKSNKKSFSVPFPESIKPIFESETELKLFYSKEFKNYWRAINDEEELEIVSAWQKQKGSLIFLRDCLSASIALDRNLIDPTPENYTEIGLLERNAKHNRDKVAIDTLAKMVAQKIKETALYKEADLICSVPPSSNKSFDLPSAIASKISAETGKPDITKGFVFAEEKSSLTKKRYDEKWDTWEKADISFEDKFGYNVAGKTVILIDDKYQSGITIQYIAMKLQEAKIQEIYGLSIVKTLGDQDNTTKDK